MNNDNGNPFIIIEILLKEERKQKGETGTACPLWRNGKIQTGYKRSKGNMKTITAGAKTRLGSDIIFVSFASANCHYGFEWSPTD